MTTSTATIRAEDIRQGDFYVHERTGTWFLVTRVEVIGPVVSIDVHDGNPFRVQFIVGDEVRVGPRHG